MACGLAAVEVGLVDRAVGVVGPVDVGAVDRHPDRSGANPPSWPVTMVCGLVPSRLALMIVPVAAVGPVNVGAVDRHPFRSVLAGDDGLWVAPIEVGLVDRAVAEVGPVDVGAVDRHPDRSALTGDDGLWIGPIEVGPCDRAVVLGPVDVAGGLSEVAVEVDDQVGVSGEVEVVDGDVRRPTRAELVGVGDDVSGVQFRSEASGGLLPALDGYWVR